MMDFVDEFSALPVGVRCIVPPPIKI